MPHLPQDTAMRRLGLAALLAAALTTPAAAQLSSRRSAAPTGGTGAVRPPPPALPGLQGRVAPEPIPADPNVSLSPNAALFDAINRGDLPAARDAVARGAETESRNVLGLTPIDAAVDQGRTEIMFYLLSVRGATRVAPEPPQATAPARPAPAPRRPTPAPAAALPEAPRAAPAGPRLWAGDGGAPIPSIGFLGFDAGRPAGAAAPYSPDGPRGTRGRTGRG